MADRDDSFFQDPSTRFDERPQKAKASSGGAWVYWLFGLISVGALCGCLCCGGAAGFFMNMVLKEVETVVVNNPKLTDEVGLAVSLSVNWIETGSAEDDVYVFNVKGSKSTGKLVAKCVTGDDGDEVIVWAKLKTQDGRVIQIVP